MAIHFLINFDIFKWLYLTYFWVYWHQTWWFCKTVCTLWPCGSIVANPLIYRLVPSPSRFEIRQWLVRSSPERAVLVRALSGDVVVCSWARHFTLTVDLSTKVYKWVPGNCWGKVRNSRGVTCHGLLASLPGRVEILLAASCCRNRDKFQQLSAGRLQGFTFLRKSGYSA